MTRRQKWLVVAFTGTALATGCRLTEDTPPTPVARLLGPGWNCLAAPSAFDGPGTIFRVTSDGTKFTVTELGSQAGVRREPFAAPTATQTVEVGAGVVAQIIGVPLSAEASVTDRFRVEQAFGGAEELNTTDDGVRGVVDAFYARRDLDRRQRYFLVRRAVVARSVRYDFDRDISGSLGVDIAVEVARIKPSARYSRTGGFHYEDTFAQPQNVCILAEALPVPRPPAGVSAAPAVPAPSDTPLFRAVGRGTR